MKKETISNPCGTFRRAYGITKSIKNKINKESDQKKDIVSLAERKQQVLDGILKTYIKDLGEFIQE